MTKANEDTKTKTPLNKSNVEGFVIQQTELDKLNNIRLELHEIATHNPQVELILRATAAKLWPIINRTRVWVG